MTSSLCGPLAPVADFDETYFLQFLRIEVRPSAGKGGIPGIMPGAGYLAGARASKRRSKTAPVSGKVGESAKNYRTLLANVRSKFGTAGSKADMLAIDSAVASAREMLLGGKLWETDRIAVGGACWLVGLQFRQTWTCRDIGAGRLIAAVPVGLYPGTKRVELKIWGKTVEASSENLSTETLYSTEITSSDKWSLATKKLFAEETASEINPSATINSLGVSVPGTVGVTGSGSLGVSGSFRSNVRDQVDTTSEYIADRTSKSANSLKAARTIDVSVTRETGVERLTSEVLSNPNRGSTLNYLYWEILETYEIGTVLERVDPYLSVPLPIDSVVLPEWLLQHECVIRPHLPCERLAAGFDAAKNYLKLEAQLALLDAQTAVQAKVTPAQDKAATDLIKAVEDLLAIYDEISTANPANGRTGSWAYWSLAGIVADNDLRRGLKGLKTNVTALGATPKAQDVSVAMADALKAIGSLSDAFTRV